ncbi:unnamed protein product [Closterium sp. NIES-54]
MPPTIEASAAPEIGRLLPARTIARRDLAPHRSDIIIQGRSDLKNEGRTDLSLEAIEAEARLTSPAGRMAVMEAGERTTVAGPVDRAGEGAVVADPVHGDAGRQSAVSGRNGADEPAEQRVSANHSADRGADQGGGGARALQESKAAGAEEDERRDDGLSFWQHMVAGSVAVANPASAAAQSLSHSPTIRNAVSSILKTEGAAGLYRGIAAMVLGAGPAHAVYFAVYEAAKESLLRNSSSSGSSVSDGLGFTSALGVSLPPAVAHATAGALATVASDAVLTPMDVVKQRLQLRRSPYAGVVDCCRKPCILPLCPNALSPSLSRPHLPPSYIQMLQEEGIHAFYRSYRTTLVTNVPFTAVFITSVPPCPPHVLQMIQEEGIYSFYRSYRTTLVMNVPFTAVHFATYEASKAGLGRALPGEALPGEGVLDEDRLLTHVLAGGAAGALASAVTNPLDVVKTRLQCQGVCGVKRMQSASVTAALSSIVREEGWGALLRGMRARMLFHTPAAAIVWSTYEASKNLLRDL